MHQTIRGVALAALATGALLAGCTKPTTPPPAGPGPFATEAAAVQGAAPDTRPWFCNATGHGTPPSGHGNGSHLNPYYDGKTKGPLTWADCLLLARQLDQLVAATGGLETRAKAERAGWFDVGAGYIPGLGTHHITLGGFLPATGFDPAKPTNLIYGGTTPDAPLVGVAYASFGATPPEPAFAGGNDWWHLHNSFCTGGDVKPGEDLSEDECRARGGTPVTSPKGAWLLHLWLYPPYEYRPDLFVSGHPCLLATAAAPLGDPCWEAAHRDPALGPPPTTDPDTDPDHGAHGH
jgi:hypothetical protein